MPTSLAICQQMLPLRIELSRVQQADTAAAIQQDFWPRPTGARSITSRVGRRGEARRDVGHGSGTAVRGDGRPPDGRDEDYAAVEVHMGPRPPEPPHREWEVHRPKRPVLAADAEYRFHPTGELTEL